MEKIIDSFSEIAKRYTRSIVNRRVFPSSEDIDNLSLFDIPLQTNPIDPLDVIKELDAVGSPGTVANTGNRYFGFVIGGSLPAPLGANLLAGVWDQNAGIEVTSPVSSCIESVCRKWLLDILNLPKQSEVGFVTGGTMANFTALAAARHALLSRVGWDVENDGLFNAPPIQVIVGEEVHVSLLKALSMLGFGRNRLIRVPVDNQGRIKPESIPRLSGPTLICIQAGNVNTGAFDPIGEICALSSMENAWVHVDGAFGLWAAASPKYRCLVKDIEKADSWATDAHKWLNVPYDSGLVFVKEKEYLVSSMSTTAAYLQLGSKREPYHYVPELSRRSRGVEIWAALRSLGKDGLSKLIESNCENAVLFANRLSSAGYQILNDVVLNQVLVSFGEPDITKAIVQKIQNDGTCWCGGTQWQGNTAMRISVSSWQTTKRDIEDSVEAIINIAKTENSKCC